MFMIGTRYPFGSLIDNHIHNVEESKMISNITEKKCPKQAQEAILRVSAQLDFALLRATVLDSRPWLASFVKLNTLGANQGKSFDLLAFYIADLYCCIGEIGVGKIYNTFIYLAHQLIMWSYCFSKVRVSCTKNSMFKLCKDQTQLIEETMNYAAHLKLERKP